MVGTVESDWTVANSVAVAFPQFGIDWFHVLGCMGYISLACTISRHQRDSPNTGDDPCRFTLGLRHGLRCPIDGWVTSTVV